MLARDGLEIFAIDHRRAAATSALHPYYPLATEIGCRWQAGLAVSDLAVTRFASIRMGWRAYE
jgi:hypothetical protein